MVERSEHNRRMSARVKEGKRRRDEEQALQGDTKQYKLEGVLCLD